MRRKSERTASKKAKAASPEKKIEKVKRTRTRRRKQSTSSEESAEEGSPVRPAEEIEIEKKPPSTPVKEDSPEEAQDQVWQVKAAEGSGDVGEIQKLKICLTRPPSTPERVDKSPRSKRKHSRATSSSDTPSVEGVEEKRKSRHHSKRSTRDSRDDSDKTQDSQGEEPEVEAEQQSTVEQSEVSQSTKDQEECIVDTTNSTTNEEENKKELEATDSTENQESQNNREEVIETQEKISDADTTVASPKPSPHSEEQKGSENDNSLNISVEKSEILELHAEESKCDISETQLKDEDSQETTIEKVEDKIEKVDQDKVSSDKQVSTNEDKMEVDDAQEIGKTVNDSDKSNKTDVVESSDIGEKRGVQNMSTDSTKDLEEKRRGIEDLDHNESLQTPQDESAQNCQAPPIVINRKRKWGSRPKITTQKSITISTDVLKEIIPDVKPVEFEEVIEEKKHKRIEISERVERPILPKIVIDNTDNAMKEKEDKEPEKLKEVNLSMNRRISIVKENDSIIARPPSPPRHKQSNILFITNLVRPFTLPQLKNLLQRTGRIMENGFWIDRIKSKCFVKYETEDQAVETRHALHGVTWPVSNPKTLQVDFSNEEAFDKAKSNEETENAQTSTIPGTVEDWLREQDIKRERGELEKPWERKAAMREWDVGKNEKDKEKDRQRRDERPLDKRHHRPEDRSPEPARKFKKKEEEAPAKLLDDLFRKTKATPCIYWLPLSDETIAIKEEQRRQHMAEHERRLQELRRTHRRH